MRLRYALSILLGSLVLQACNAGPESTKPTPPTNSASSPQANSNESISAEDKKYANDLEALNRRNPQREAKQAMARGERFLIGYYSGRAGLKTPGLSSEQQTNQTCKINTADGLGDVIYGENHLKYRIAMRTFAKTFNTEMLSVCL